MTPKKIFGIDLGTTYSCISCVDEFGKPVIIPNAEGEMTTPSVVYFESPDNIVVGKTAKEHSDIFPDRVVSCVKRSMGSDVWVFECDSVMYKPQEIAAFILRKLVRDVKSSTGEDVEEAIITCPAYFGVNQKEATRQAGQLAGLTVRYIIPEPTAAALVYLTERHEDQTVLVYDLGGGTFDITLIRLHGDDITVLSTGGDDKLGGRNWDETIVDYFVQSFCDQTGAEHSVLYDDRELFQELVTAAENCKKSLSSQNAFRKNIRTGQYKAQVELTRELFDELTRPLLLRTLTFTENLLDDAAQNGHPAIDKLLLVGGSTYMPQIHAGLTERFGDRFPVLQFRPNQAVAEGAALYGQQLFLHTATLDEVSAITGEKVCSMDEVSPDVRAEALRELESKLGVPAQTLSEALTERATVTNVSSKGFGIVVMTDQGPRVRNLIYKDDPVPCTVHETFGTFEPDQTNVELRLMENPCADHKTDLLELDFCTDLSSVILELDMPLPEQSPIEVTFCFGEDGLLTMEATERTYGHSLTCRVETDSLMTANQLYEATEKNQEMTIR